MSPHEVPAPLSVASFEQSVDPTQLVLILRSLGGSDASGLLAVQGEDDLVSLTFRKGDIVAADAMNRTMEEVLSDVLAQRGLLAPEAFREIARARGDDAQLISESLIAAGKLERHVVLDCVREQILRHSLQLLRWQEGVLQWVEGGESPFQSGVVPLTVGELLLRSVEELGVAGPLGALEPDFDCGYTVADDAEGRFRQRTSKDSFDHDLKVHLLTPLELEVMRRVRSGTRTRELIPNGARQGWQVRFALHYLAYVGLLQRQFSGEGRARGRRPQAKQSAPVAPAVARDAAKTPESGVRAEPLDDEQPSAVPMSPPESAPVDAASDEEPADSLLSLGDDGQLGSLLEAPPDLDAGPLAVELPKRPLDVEITREASPALLDDGPLDDEPLEELLRGGSDLDLGSTFGSGPLVVEGELVQDDVADDDYGPADDPYAPSGDPGASAEGQHLAGLINLWGVRFLALLLLALLVRHVAGESSSLQPVPGVSETGELGEIAGRVAWGRTTAKLAQALRTYHLVYGTYPDDLEVLVDLDLCSEEDLQTADGRRVAYQLEGSGYRLEAGSEAEISTPLPPATASVVDDFLLNPKYVQPDARPGSAPVVLLD